MPTQTNHLFSAELTSMHTRILPWEENLPEAAPEQPFLCAGSITAMSVCHWKWKHPFLYLQATGVSHSVSGVLWFLLFIQDRVNEVAEGISLFFVSCAHSTSHCSMLFALYSSGFHLTICVVTPHVAGLCSTPLFLLCWYFPCLCWKTALMLL